MYWILFIGIAVVSYLVQANLKRKFEKYSEVTVASGMTGAEVAQKMLRDNGIFDVRVQPHEGWLSDHYDPSCKTVNLSQDVYHSNSVAAAAVAAHECGHAVQHARGYAFLRLRSALVPAVQFSSSIMTWVILGGILLINVFPTLLLIGILLFALTTLFSFVTLPVEIALQPHPAAHGRRRLKVGRLHLCGGGPVEPCHAGLLPVDIPIEKRLRALRGDGPIFVSF